MEAKKILNNLSLAASSVNAYNNGLIKKSVMVNFIVNTLFPEVYYYNRVEIF